MTKRAALFSNIEIKSFIIHSPEANTVMLVGHKTTPRASQCPIFEVNVTCAHAEAQRSDYPTQSYTGSKLRRGAV